jgi:hypothetical protein
MIKKQSYVDTTFNCRLCARKIKKGEPYLLDKAKVLTYYGSQGKMHPLHYHVKCMMYMWGIEVAPDVWLTEDEISVDEFLKEAKKCVETGESLLNV